MSTHLLSRRAILTATTTSIASLVSITSLGGALDRLAHADTNTNAANANTNANANANAANANAANANAANANAANANAANANAANANAANVNARGSRVVRVGVDERGVTLVMELEHAPFPAPGSWHRDPTVIVFVPRHYRPNGVGTHSSASRLATTSSNAAASAARAAAANGSFAADAVSFVVHFHGHNSTAERAMVAHQLREQLFDSKQNAILVVPELAAFAADSSAGKLETPGAFARMLDDVLATINASREARTALGASAPSAAATVGRVCVSAHSGGYHAAACAIRAGGARVHEVYLFDALYADTDVFREWVIEGRGKPMGQRHKLVSYFTAGTTESNTRRLFSELEQAGVACVHETVEGTLSREDITHAEAVSIRTQLTHGTVTSELNSLRDCLYASALKRRLRSSWFDTKQGSRPLERRR